MITPQAARTLAEYNRWMNRKIFAACDRLSDAARKEERRAFFHSIHGTLNHLLYGDKMWLARFTDSPKPAGTLRESWMLVDRFQDLKAERERLDQAIIDWAAGLDEAWLAGELRWFSAALNVEMVKPRGLLVAHLFNHQTHHRGQVHCMLTQTGVDPGDTDLCFMSIQP
jgi:uncharacterized damage-inducible protein DinB